MASGCPWQPSMDGMLFRIEEIKNGNRSNEKGQPPETLADENEHLQIELIEHLHLELEL
jgi:hypothetical protein